MSRFHEIIQSLGVAHQEVVWTEEAMGNHDLFWRIFSQLAFSHVLMNEFDGNPEGLVRWAEEVWAKDPNYERGDVKNAIIEPSFANGARYSVGIIPHMINGRDDREPQLRFGFTLKVWPKRERDIRRGDTGTYIDILPDLTPVRLTLWLWVDREISISPADRVLAIHPLTVYFQDGKVSGTSNDPDIPRNERERLLKEFEKGPASELWFPRNLE